MATLRRPLSQLHRIALGSLSLLLLVDAVLYASPYRFPREPLKTAQQQRLLLADVLATYPWWRSTWLPALTTRIPLRVSPLQVRLNVALTQVFMAVVTCLGGETYWLGCGVLTALLVVLGAASAAFRTLIGVNVYRFYAVAFSLLIVQALTRRLAQRARRRARWARGAHRPARVAAKKHA
ncbi:hypothetical protein CDCA_CDCA04G1369 [Cyanidium caldarium]|uniref:Uncharacterized protein n=1 Tax=Cyanidium caldarium TaxID=2771 RepID=A0AAV9ISX6_CYACA|nr:hypothetical protein CDCA_CDCA04G1369 [Cyanidium caldarium]